MKASIVFYWFVVYFLSAILLVNCWTWGGKTHTNSTHKLETTKPNLTQCCTKDSPDCCCTTSEGEKVNFIKAGKKDSLKRLSCKHYNECNTNGYVC